VNITSEAAAFGIVNGKTADIAARRAGSSKLAQTSVREYSNEGSGLKKMNVALGIEVGCGR